jgi:hypothetical protein
MQYSAAFAVCLVEACRAPMVRIPDTVDLASWFSLPWDEVVAMDPT